MTGDDWQNQRLEATYEEARAVLEAQNSTMSDIDTKAMRTVQFNALLIGLFLTAAQIASPSVFHPESLYVAVGALVVSVLLGLATYSESGLYVGPRGTYIEALANGDTADERWDQDLLETFAGMISENADDLTWNSWLLTATQTALAVGIVAGVVSILI